MMKEEKESIEKIDNEQHVKKNKKGKVFLILAIIMIAFIILVISLYFYLKIYTTPKNVVVEDNESHKIDITWEHPSNNYNYLIVISSKEFSGEDVINNLKENKTLSDDYQVIEVKDDKKITVDSVLSDTDYFISVIAYYEINGITIYSNSSDIVKKHTEAIELSAVNDFVAEEIKDKSIKLKWDSLELEEKNFDNTDIEISYKLFSIDSDNNSAEIASDIKENEYIISDLEPFARYRYKIVANAVIDGKNITSEGSEEIEVITKGEGVPKLTAKSNGTSSIIISWDKYKNINVKNDDGSTPTVTYTIYGADSKDGKYKVLSEKIKSTSYTESNLSENKTRYYYVIAKIEINNNKYESMKSNIVNATTDKIIITNNSNVSNNNSTSSESSSNKTSTTSGASSNKTSTSSGSSSNKPSSNKSQSNNSGSGTSNNSSSSSKLTKAQKEAQARAVAKKIARSITGSTDLEKVSKAAQAVSGYYYQGVHKESGEDYATAYGVFIKGESSCAGCTRALGMVLEEMGYSWKHVNENQWTHQWVIVTMDGKVGYADGQVGWAGYGTHPYGG